MSGIAMKKHWKYGARGLVVMGFLAIVIWSFFLESNVTPHERVRYPELNHGWTQMVSGTAVPLELAQDAVPPPTGEPITIIRTLPTIEPGETLVFYCIHQEVDVYVADEPIYQLRCPESMSFFKSPGRLWVSIPLGAAMSGQTIRMEFSSPFPMYRMVPATLYCVQSRDIQSVQVEAMWVRNAVAFGLLALALISYVNAGIWKNPKLRRYIFSLADLYLFTSLWLCCEINVLAVWIGHSTATALLSMVFIRMIPVCFYQFIISSTVNRPLWIRGIGVLAWANLVLSLVMQFVFGVSLVSTLPLTAAVYGLSCVGYLVGMVYQRWSQRMVHLYDRAYYAASVMLVATLVELFCFACQETLGQWNGVFVSVACIIYACIAHVLIVSQNAATEVKKRELEQRQNSLERKPLYQQINAHFLFNALNTISAYCKEYPARADQAVSWLAQYLRRYMKLVDCGEYVPFTEEVSLIELYLKIQDLRYEEEITFVIDAQCQAFVLPPLTLQPLVENAVAHGIHGHVNQGEVRVATRRHGNMVEMVVTDNGQGFDIEPGTQTYGVGLSNLNRRITAMGGVMWMHSAPDKGTEVIIRVPIDPVEYHEKDMRK